MVPLHRVNCFTNGRPKTKAEQSVCESRSCNKCSFWNYKWGILCSSKDLVLQLYESLVRFDLEYSIQV